ASGFYVGMLGWTVKLWDVTTGQGIRTVRGQAPHGVSSVTFSPDGRRIASGELWDPEEHPTPAVRVWDAGTGEEVLSLKGEGIGSLVQSLAFSPDGAYLATGSGSTGQPNKPVGQLKVWDARTGQELLTLASDCSEVRCLVYSPDGKFLAAAIECSGSS